MVYIYLNIYASIVKEIQISLFIYVHRQSSLAMCLCTHIAKPGHHTVPGQAAQEAVYKYTVHIFANQLTSALLELNSGRRGRLTAEIFSCPNLHQTELPRPIPRKSVESDHRCTSRIYFDNAGDNVTLTMYNVTLTSQKPC